MLGYARPGVQELEKKMKNSVAKLFWETLLRAAVIILGIGIVAMSMNSCAYVAEVIRSGIQAVDYGQTEAARSVGFSSGEAMRLVVLPQAIRNILPAIANEFVTIIKESAICFTIGVQDIMSAVNSVKGATYRITEALVIATALYFCLTYPTSKVIAHFEKKMSAGSSRNAANVAHKRKVQAQEGTK